MVLLKEKALSLAKTSWQRIGEGMLSAHRLWASSGLGPLAALTVEELVEPDTSRSGSGPGERRGGAPAPLKNDRRMNQIQGIHSRSGSGTPDGKSRAGEPRKAGEDSGPIRIDQGCHEEKCLPPVLSAHQDSNRRL